MILCDVRLFELGKNETVKIDDSGTGKEVLDDLNKIFGGKGGVLLSVDKKAPISKELTLYDQGIRNGESLIYIINGALQRKEK